MVFTGKSTNCLEQHGNIYLLSLRMKAGEAESRGQTSFQSKHLDRNLEGSDHPDPGLHRDYEVRIFYQRFWCCLLKQHSQTCIIFNKMTQTKK